MINKFLAFSVLTASLVTPAFAQSPQPATPKTDMLKQHQSSMPANKSSTDKNHATDTKAPQAMEKNAEPNNAADKMANAEKRPGFVQSQNETEWRASKLIGASVIGPDNKSIGEINELILDQQGGIKAAVIGVGGFLGIGEKNVAVPFEALNVQRKPNSTAVEKIAVSYSKDQLKNAPKFAYYQAHKAKATTTGMNPGGAMPPLGGAHPPRNSASPK